jgi:hypothetical protein
VGALIVLLALLEGVFFDTRDFRKLGYQSALVSRVLRSLVDSKVLMKIHDRRYYVLTNEFRETLKLEVQRKTPKSGIHRFPSLDVFYVGGMEDWSEHQFGVYAGEMKSLWRRLSRSRAQTPYPRR